MFTMQCLFHVYFLDTSIVFILRVKIHSKRIQRHYLYGISCVFLTDIYLVR